MDFDGNKEKGFVNWNFEEKRMKNLRTFAAVFAPGIVVCFLFSVNVITINAAKRVPALHKAEPSLTYMAAVKKGITLSLSER